VAIDWNAFTPWSSLVGGVFIGVAVAILILVNGRVAGISGIIGGLLRPTRGGVAWRAAFVLGLILTPSVFMLFVTPHSPQIDDSIGALVAAGLLVGIGTRYGSGCTSGHGICGLSRRSPRSLVATAVFMTAGFVTVFVARHVLGG
jgi:uncharacterized membrane protein YedE/YeeE